MRFLRWMVGLGLPVPALSQEDADALVERELRWNYGVNLADGVIFFLGTGFLSFSTIVPLFVSKLTTSLWPIGLVAVLGQAGWSLPQILSANWIERLPWRKPVVMRAGFFLEQLPGALLVVAALLAGSRPQAALFLFLGLLTWRAMGSGLIAPAWQSMIARVIPVRRRGSFWGVTTATGLLLGAGGSALSAWLLERLPFSGNFAALFAMAALAFVSGWAFIALTREPPSPVSQDRRSQGQFFAALPGLLRQDVPFRRFLVAYGLLSLGVMGQGFVAVSAVARMGVTDGTVALYTGLLLLGQSAGSLLFGLVADRRGHKHSLEWAGGLFAAAFGLAWLAPSAEWYYPVFLLLGVAAGTRLVSGILVVMEFCEPRRLPTYVGVANTTVGLTSIAGPLAGAWLAGIDYRLLFGVSAAFGLAALVALKWWVHEPRWASPAPTR